MGRKGVNAVHLPAMVLVRLGLETAVCDNCSGFSRISGTGMHITRAVKRFMTV